MKYKNVVWDWNGTLLNDVKVGVNTLNDMLGRRGLPLLSVEDYKEKFGFPVIDFYDRVGFDMEKESFHELSVDFVETYDKYAGEVGLNEGVREVLHTANRCKTVCPVCSSGRFVATDAPAFSDRFPF